MYVLRDADSGQLLKVGKSEVANFRDRFLPYERAGRATRTGRSLELDVYSFKRGNFTAEAVEGEIRATLTRQGHRLPWDNTGQRLGRPGPGVPGAPIPRRLRVDVKWDFTLETLVPKGWNLGG